MIPSVALADLFRQFLRIGLLSFGGPAAQIALMHRVLVDERGWLNERQFLNALSFCMLLPGPEAMQLATYAGWRLRGIAGGLVAGLLFVIPGALVIFVLATLYVLFADLPLVDTLFLGVQAAAVVIVVEALARISRRALHGTAQRIIAGLAFVAIFALGVPFPVIILLAGLYGAFTARTDAIDGTVVPAPVTRGDLLRTAVTVIIGLIVWFLPLVILDATAGAPILTALGTFFSRLAVVTFGGAYAVLAYMAQDVVIEHGWLTAGEMMDGLGLAETTPGPLILVTQFVGFLASWREGGFGLAVAGAMITLWVTFVPCFLWIFTGAPWIDRIAAQPRLAGALGAITAAVVGVILNLSVWFALHVLFDTVAEWSIGPITLWRPVPASIRPVSVLLILLAGYLLLKRHTGIARVLLLTATTAWLLAPTQ